MGIGYSTFVKMRRAEELANKLGFRFIGSKYGYSDDVIALQPLSDSLPDYSRDAELYRGDLDSVEAFLQGIVWSRDYLKMIRVVTEGRIARKEQDSRNRQLVAQLNGDPTGDIKG